MNEPTGTIKGKEKVRAYWAQALERLPDLHFDLIEVLASVDSITIYYHAVLASGPRKCSFSTTTARSGEPLPITIRND